MSSMLLMIPPLFSARLKRSCVEPGGEEIKEGTRVETATAGTKKRKTRQNIIGTITLDYHAHQQRKVCYTKEGGDEEKKHAALSEGEPEQTLSHPSSQYSSAIRKGVGGGRSQRLVREERFKAAKKNKSRGRKSGRQKNRPCRAPLHLHYEGTALEGPVK